MDYDIASRKIFIGGLSYGTDDDKLKQYFQQFGSVHDAVVMKDPISRRSRGFGFITYEHASYVDIALSQEVHTIDSRQVEAKRAVPRSDTRESTPGKSTSNFVNHSNFISQSPQHPSSPRHDGLGGNSHSKIFVGGLHYDTRDGEFRNYFEKYGKVVTSEVMFNRETHKSRGFGFIVFESEKSVDDVCAEREHYIDGKMVEVKRAVPRAKLLSPQHSSPTTTYKQPSTSLFNNSSTQPPPLQPLPAPLIQNTPNQQDNMVRDSSADVGSKPGISSYAAALKSGAQSSSQPPASLQSQHNPSQISNPFFSFDQAPTQQISSPIPHTHGLLSEPVNVTGYLRSHAGSLSEIDMHSQYSIYDPQMVLRHQQQQLRQDNYQLNQTASANNPIGHSTMPSRHRAHTESFLMMQSQQQPQQSQTNYIRPPFYQRNQTISFTNTVNGGNNANLSQIPQNFQSHLVQLDDQLKSPAYLETFGLSSVPNPAQFAPNNYSPQVPQSPSSVHSDHHLPMSPLQQLNSSSSSTLPSWNFNAQRSEIERSVSLGGVGWTPSSIVSPSRRGFSDVGLTNIGISFHSPQLNSVSGEVLVGPTMSSNSGLFSNSGHHDLPLDEPSVVPSPSAWASMIEKSMGLHDSQLGVPGGINSQSISLDPDDFRIHLDYSPADEDMSSSLTGLSILETRNHSGTSFNKLMQNDENSLHPRQDDHDHGGTIQELRLQAQEFIPQFQHQWS